MKQLATTILVLYFSVSSFAQQYTWLQKANFPGTIRGAAVGFAIGDSGYVGTGFNTAGTYFNDFYKWDHAANTWSAIASLPASARYAAVGFSIGNYGYVGTGWSASLSQLDDFWRYDPSTNTWTSIATFPGSPRYTASVCVVNSKAYFGLGYLPLFSDVWEYDPATNSWTQKANFPGGARQSAVAFALGNYAYFLTGNDGSNKKDMYRYDPATNTWTQKTDFPGAARYGAVAMELNGKAIVGTGGDGSSFFTDFYEYDGTTDTWCQIPNLPALGRRHVAEFSIGNQAYLATGVTSASGIGVGDLWELTNIPATFTINTSPCNLTVGFNQTSTNATAYSWSFGDGNTGTAANPSHTYPSLGTYNVQLIVYYNCGTDTVNQQVTITGTPAFAQFSYQQTSCSYNVDFTNTSTGASTCQWNFGDGITDTLFNTSHQYAAPGNYTVTLYAINACDTDTTQLNITVSPIQPPAVAAYTYSITPCTYTVNFINTSAGGNSYLWIYGDGNADTTAATSHYHNYAAPGNYSISLIVTNSCDTDTLIQQINIPPINSVQPSFAVQQIFCTNDVQFTNNTLSGLNYLWSFGDGNTSNSVSPLHSYAAPGNYTVTLTAYGLCDTVVIQQQVNVAATSVVNSVFTYSINICDSSIMLTNNSTGANFYEWSFGDGSISTLSQPVHNYNSSGTYTITLTAYNACDTDVTQQNITIAAYAPVVAAFSYSVLPCSLQVTFNNLSSGVTSLLWLFGDGSTDTVANPIHAYINAMQYHVTLIVTDICSSDTLSMPVDLTGAVSPTAGFNISTQPCDSLALSFISTSVNSTYYQWDYGDGSTGAGSTTYHIYSNPGTYAVTLIATNNCGADTIVQNIIIDTLSNPNADFRIQVTPCTGIVTFTDSSTNASTYNWYFGDGAQSNIQNPVHTYADTGNYIVTLIINIGQPCTDSVSIPVLIDNANLGDWFIPNCFTPNDDGINDVLEIRELGDCLTYTLKIFNRWGSLIFKSDEKLKVWDGKFENNQVPEGTYIYIVTVDGQNHTGVVTLLR